MNLQIPILFIIPLSTECHGLTVLSQVEAFSFAKTTSLHLTGKQSSPTEGTAPGQQLNLWISCMRSPQRARPKEGRATAEAGKVFSEKVFTHRIAWSWPHQVQDAQTDCISTPRWCKTGVRSCELLVLENHTRVGPSRCAIGQDNLSHYVSVGCFWRASCQEQGSEAAQVSAISSEWFRTSMCFSSWRREQRLHIPLKENQRTREQFETFTQHYPSFTPAEQLRNSKKRLIFCTVKSFVLSGHTGEHTGRKHRSCLEFSFQKQLVQYSSSLRLQRVIARAIAHELQCRSADSRRRGMRESVIRSVYHTLAKPERQVSWYRLVSTFIKKNKTKSKSY